MVAAGYLGHLKNSLINWLTSDMSFCCQSHDLISANDSSAFRWWHNNVGYWCVVVRNIWGNLIPTRCKMMTTKTRTIHTMIPGQCRMRIPSIDKEVLVVLLKHSWGRPVQWLGYKQMMPLVFQCRWLITRNQPMCYASVTCGDLKPLQFMLWTICLSRSDMNLLIVYKCLLKL